jgi:hypothetical protein
MAGVCRGGPRCRKATRRGGRAACETSFTGRFFNGDAPFPRFRPAAAGGIAHRDFCVKKCNGSRSPGLRRLTQAVCRRPAACCRKESMPALACEAPGKNAASHDMRCIYSLASKTAECQAKPGGFHPQIFQKRIQGIGNRNWKPPIPVPIIIASRNLFRSPSCPLMHSLPQVPMLR